MNKDNLETIIEGYKVFNPDWTCRNFKYEVGKTYEHDGDIEVCEAGFHFCQKAIDCFNYYSFDNKNKVAKIEAIGLIKTDGDKSVTNKITIVKEIEWEELLNIVNIGNNNTGYGNTGNRNTGYCNSGNWNEGCWNTGNYNTGYCNSGNWNTGNYNTGNHNTGYCNSGNWNEGCWNTGNYNTGYCNSGNWNTGNYNTGNHNTGYCNSGNWNEGCWNTGNYNIGNCNSGDWNIGDYNAGVFCTDVPKIRMFNKETDLTYEDWMNSEARNILKRNSYLTKWIRIDDMTEEEEKNNPGYEINNGYLKVFTFEEMCKNMWDSLTEEEKKIIMEIPNFDRGIFKEITGIEGL
ncbi:pentapeptide repeat-containing protein [Clostridioides difficile]|uniref:pentapeptide repeat-containing protein n=1 Tax=Clostridioides difficile TaxID=1496 RepID=UPI00093B2752|nr:PPE family protein [Clostridioides difficile]